MTRPFTIMRFFLMWERLQFTRSDYQHARICCYQKLRIVQMYPDVFKNI